MRRRIIRSNKLLFIVILLIIIQEREEDFPIQIWVNVRVLRLYVHDSSSIRLLVHIHKRNEPNERRHLQLTNSGQGAKKQKLQSFL